MKLSLQTILLIVFGFFILFGVAVFAGYINLGSSSSSSTPSGSVTMWGTIDKRSFNIFLGQTSTKDQTYTINYVQKSTVSYEQELIEALASGKGPDLFMVTPEIFWKERDKIFVIPYQNIPARTFADTYMDIASIYTQSDGILALPLFVDPLVGYWNKDIFASAGIATPPTLWKEFPDLSKKLSLINTDFSITRSTVAFGEYDNVNHAKDIMSLLFLQAGDPITSLDYNNVLQATLGSVQKNNQNAAGVALSFYTQFANSTNRDIYSWNKTFTSDRDQFLAGDLAYYVGLGSELIGLRKTNPNLNFDISLIPQPDKDGTKTTTGALFGVAISKQATNVPLAFYAASDITTQTKSGALLETLGKNGLTLAPVRRDLMPNDPGNAYAGMLYQSALISRTWIDPDPRFTSGVFAGMVSDVQSGKLIPIAAVSDARNKMTAYLKQLEKAAK